MCISELSIGGIHVIIFITKAFLWLFFIILSRFASYFKLNFSVINHRISDLVVVHGWCCFCLQQNVFDFICSFCYSQTCDVTFLQLNELKS